MVKVLATVCKLKHSKFFEAKSLVRYTLVGKSARLVIESLRVRILAGAAEESSSPELTLRADSYSMSVLPRVTAVGRKGPGHSAKNTGSRLHLNTHIFLTQRSRSGLTMPLSGHSEGTYQETSSHATRKGTVVSAR